MSAASPIRGLWAGLRPRPRRTVTEWAEAERIIPRGNAFPGPYRVARTPYLREIMDALGVESLVEEVYVRKGSQLGFSEAGNNFVGYAIAEAPGPILYVQPTIPDARKYSTQRLAPMIEASDALRMLVSESKSRRSQNTISLKEFPGGTLGVVGANAPSGLASTPIRYLFADECERYTRDAGGEGDPLEIARARIWTFESSIGAKTFVPSTPAEREGSRIDELVEQGDLRFWFLPCPSCGHRAPLFFEPFSDRIPEPARRFRPHLLLDTEPSMVCQSCGALANEHAVKGGGRLALGEWVPTKEPKSDRVRSHDISALYSPWFTWERLLERWATARDKGTTKVKPFVNTILGMSYEEPHLTIDLDVIRGRQRFDSKDGVLPDGVLLVTVGADVQGDRIEYEVVGWGRGDESWSLEYGIVSGDPWRLEVWRQFDERISRSWRFESGVHVRPRNVCVDSQYATGRVYRFARPREHRGVFAVTGKGGLVAAPLVRPSPRKLGKHRSVKILAWVVDTDQIKTEILDALNVEEPGPRFVNVPADRSEVWFDQMGAERPRRDESGSLRWEKSHHNIRNEALDCRVYATAAREIARPNYENLARQLEQAAARVERERKGGGAPAGPRRRRMVLRRG